MQLGMAMAPRMEMSMKLICNICGSSNSRDDDDAKWLHRQAMQPINEPRAMAWLALQLSRCPVCYGRPCKPLEEVVERYAAFLEGRMTVNGNIIGKSRGYRREDGVWVCPTGMASGASIGGW